MSRRLAKKAAEKREQSHLEPRRPAGIQAMDSDLYEHIRRAIRCLECATPRA